LQSDDPRRWREKPVTIRLLDVGGDKRSSSCVAQTKNPSLA